MEIKEGFEISNKVDSDGEVEIECGGTYVWVDKKLAKKIIKHLKKVFDLKEGK